MATKRSLKQSINAVCQGLFADGLALYLYGPKVSDENMEALMSSILMLRRDYLSRVSHPEPGILPRKYYRQLVADFTKEVSCISDQLSSVY